MIDYNDPLPGRRQYHRARGMVPIGNEWSTRPDEVSGPELWLSFEDLLTHLLVIGTTGSGKTELLLSLMFSAGLSTGSGAIYIDPKGMAKLAAQIFVLSRMLGRDDDFRLMNFNTGGKRPGRSCRRLSNTANPLSFGTAENISQTILSLVPEPEGDNAVFAQSAHALMQAEIYAVTDLRDQDVPVSIATLREYLDPDRFVALAHDPRVKEANRLSMLAFLGGVQWRENPMWELVQARLRQSTRGQDAAWDVLSPAIRGGPQQGSITDPAQQAQILEPWYQQFGFARSYFNQLMNSLVDTYGHIYNAMRPEVDMPDIILQRRILVGLLPALEKSPAETKNIGKLTLGMIRNAAATGLGSRAMGTLRDVIYSLPSAAAKPMPVITDEYAAIAVEGYELVLTQLRALGIIGAIGNQDYSGLTKGGGDKGTGPAAAGQILGNTGLKLALRTADPRETWDLFRALAAEGDVVKASRFDRPHSGAAHYSRLNDVDVRREARIDLRDLQQQIQGEFHAFFNGQIVRGRSFYASPPLPEDAQLIVHEMLQVLPPSREELDERHGAPKRIAEQLALLIRGDERLEIGGVPPGTLAAPLAVLSDQRGLDRMETAMAAVCHWIETHRKAIQTPPARVNDSGGTDEAGAQTHDRAVSMRIERALRASHDRDQTRARPSDLQLALSGMPDSPPRLSGAALSTDEIAGTAARVPREITAGLARDIANIEQALGQDPQAATEAANMFAEQISEGLEYPRSPAPQTEPDTPERLRQAIRRLVRGISPGPHREEM